MFYQLLASKHHRLGDLKSRSRFGRVEVWVWSLTKNNNNNNNKSRAKQDPRSAHGRAVNKCTFCTVFKLTTHPDSHYQHVFVFKKTHPWVSCRDVATTRWRIKNNYSKYMLYVMVKRKLNNILYICSIFLQKQRKSQQVKLNYSLPLTYPLLLQALRANNRVKKNEITKGMRS